MLNVHCLPLGAYGTNCYLVWASGSKTCAVIDPGYSPERVLSQAQKLGLSVDAILLTHGHFDHVGGVEDLIRSTGCALWMGRGDWSQPSNPITAYFYPIANREIPGLRFCEDSQRIPAGGLRFVVIATPGHTPGSVCFLCEDALFCGDTLFAGSCGRTDLPGGSWDTLSRSLGRLAAMDPVLRVFPGHGESSTMAEERRTNPYLTTGFRV